MTEEPPQPDEVPADPISPLGEDGEITDETRELVERAHPMNVTFHRAFDMTRDPLAALETLVELGDH